MGIINGVTTLGKIETLIKEEIIKCDYWGDLQISYDDFIYVGDKLRNIIESTTIADAEYVANHYPYSYMSTHTHISGNEFLLYHLMFDFSNNVR